MEIILDGRLMTDRAALHDCLAEKFSFPDYYGRNLDALYDLLTEYPTECHVTVLHQQWLLENLGRYGSSFLQTLEDACRNNAHMSFSILDENI